MTSTRKLLQRKLCCCCCVNELGAFKKDSVNHNEPSSVVLTKEAITSQPGPRTKNTSNPFATTNGHLKKESKQQAAAAKYIKMGDSSAAQNEFDEIDLNTDADAQQSSTTSNKNSSKFFLDANSSSTGSGVAGSKKSSSSKQSSEKNETLDKSAVLSKKLAEDVTDMMLNEICERAEEIDQPVEESFEVDTGAVVVEATHEEISHRVEQICDPAIKTKTNGFETNSVKEEDDVSPRSLTTTTQPMSPSSSSLKTTGRDVEHGEEEIFSLPDTPSSTKSNELTNLPKKPPRTNLHDAELLSGNAEENGVADVSLEKAESKAHTRLFKKSSTMSTKKMDEEDDSARMHPAVEKDNNHNEKPAVIKPAVLPKPKLSATIIANGQNSSSKMYGGDTSSEDEREENSSSSPTSTDNIKPLKVAAKDIEQYDYKALETDLSEKTL